MRAKPVPLAGQATGIGIVAGARTFRGILPAKQEKMAKIAQEIGKVPGVFVGGWGNAPESLQSSKKLSDNVQPVFFEVN